MYRKATARQRRMRWRARRPETLDRCPNYPDIRNRLGIAPHDAGLPVRLIPLELPHRFRRGSRSPISEAEPEVSAMGKIWIIGTIVLVVWVELEIQTKGLEGAFNGLFAPAGQEEAEAITSTPRRAGERVHEAFRQDEARKTRLLDQIDNWQLNDSSIGPPPEE
jgi:hypothetical protein